MSTTPRTIRTVLVAVVGAAALSLTLVGGASAVPTQHHGADRASMAKVGGGWCC